MDTLRVFTRGIEEVGCFPPGFHMLDLSATAGLLGMLAERLGAEQVTIATRDRQTIADNIRRNGSHARVSVDLGRVAGYHSHYAVFDFSSFPQPSLLRSVGERLHTGGIMLVSGLIRPQLERAEELLQTAGLRTFWTGTTNEDCWVLLRKSTT